MIDDYAFLRGKGVSLERLLTLCRVADAGGIAKAAGGDLSKLSLYSRQVNDLAEALDIRLTHRVGRTAALTPEAHRLAAIVRGHFRDLEAFAAVAGKNPATLRLGASNSLLEWAVLPRLPALAKALPKGTTLRLLAHRTADLVAALLDRRCDLGLVRSTAAGPSLRTRELMRFGYALFVPEGLTRQRDAARILGSVPIATSAGGEFRSQLELAAERAGVRLTIALECPSFGTAARAVLGGAHAAILPEIAAAAFAGRGVRSLALPFEAEPARTILLAAHPRVDEALFDGVARALGAAE